MEEMIKIAKIMVKKKNFRVRFLYINYKEGKRHEESTAWDRRRGKNSRDNCSRGVENRYDREQKKNISMKIQKNIN